MEQDAYSQLSPHHQRQRLKELAVVFLRLGAIAFGGPAAHISMMDEEVVERRQWMSREKLLDLLGITNLIPGPNSTELAIHIGYERGGLWGLAIAGVCFILPAMLIVWGLAAIYVQTQAIPQVGWLLYGIKAVIVAIVVQAVWKLGKKALKDTPTVIAAIAVTIAYFLNVNEILLLLLGGLAVMLFKNWQRRRNLGAMGAWMVPVGAITQVTTVPAVPAPTGLSVFLFFLKVGSVLYGSGYVLLAFLQNGLVQERHWLTSQQLLDAIAIGQFTPGPVFTTATFIGYLLAGNSGAIAATVGIFLPAFILVALINPWVPKLRQSPWASDFLDGVNAASMGLMAGVTYVLARTALVDWVTVTVAILSAIAVFRFKINSAWLVLAGALIGFLAKLLLPV
ncbi:chromate transporter [Phormidium sp. CLA17]|uniref:chromate transporter n=1 Tax=Leptolyngbya sp. Cla-17 TaxID=2803751 RepID=UPI001492A72E|nr:chromate transporter [Leptolyngbya sp. Cla-17]MBM0741378.1 chromate transporter [Leptolyngbya sp. Cla-17]